MTVVSGLHPQDSEVWVRYWKDGGVMEYWQWQLCAETAATQTSSARQTFLRTDAGALPPTCYMPGPHHYNMQKFDGTEHGSAYL